MRTGPPTRSALRRSTVSSCPVRDVQHRSSAATAAGAREHCVAGDQWDGAVGTDIDVVDRQLAELSDRLRVSVGALQPELHCDRRCNRRHVSGDQHRRRHHPPGDCHRQQRRRIHPCHVRADRNRPSTAAGAREHCVAGDQWDGAVGTDVDVVDRQLAELSDRLRVSVGALQPELHCDRRCNRRHVSGDQHRRRHHPPGDCHRQQRRRIHRRHLGRRPQPSKQRRPAAAPSAPPASARAPTR